MVTDKHQFWRLCSPGSERRLADWDDEMDYIETIHCPVHPGHQRPGRRFPRLSVVLPDAVEDFVWLWGSDCLIQDHILKLFQANGITGFDVKPVHARFARSRSKPPVLWEVITTGWAGVAPPESGIQLSVDKCCPACGLLRYTGLTNASKLINRDQWDGSDFFMVWPMPKFIFVTDRVRRLVEEHELSGCRFIDPVTLKADGFSPGPLSYHMPDARARELGEPLGIYAPAFGQIPDPELVKVDVRWADELGAILRKPSREESNTKTYPFVVLLEKMQANRLRPDDLEPDDRKLWDKHLKLPYGTRE